MSEINLKTLLANGGADELKKLFTESVSSGMNSVFALRDKAENEAAAAREAALAAEAEHEAMMAQHNAAIGKDPFGESKTSEKDDKIEDNIGAIEANTEVINSLLSSSDLLNIRLQSLDMSLNRLANITARSGSQDQPFVGQPISMPIYPTNSFSSSMMRFSGDNLGMNSGNDSMLPPPQTSSNLSSTAYRTFGNDGPVSSISYSGTNAPSISDANSISGATSSIVQQPTPPKTSLAKAMAKTDATSIIGSSASVPTVDSAKTSAGAVDAAGAAKGAAGAGGKVGALMALVSAIREYKSNKDGKKSSSSSKPNMLPSLPSHKADDEQDEIENEAFRDRVQKPMYDAMTRTVEDDAVRVKITNADELGGESGGTNAIFAGGIGALLGGVFGTIAGGLGGVVSGLAENVKGMWGEIGSAFKSVGRGVKSGLSSAWEGLKSGASRISEGARGVWNSVKNSKLGQRFSKITSSIDDFGKNVSKAGSWVSNKLKSAWTGVKSAASSVKSTVTKAAGTVKDGLSSAWKGLKGGVSKLGGKLSSVGGKVGGFFTSFGSSFKSGASKAFGAVKGAVKKIPQVQAVANYAGTVKNAYDVYKNGGSITDMMTTVGGGTIDALLNVTMLSNVMGAAGAAIDGKSLSEIGKAALDPTQGGTKVSYGMGAMANIQNLVGNETELTKRLARASNYDMTLEDAGLVALNGNIAGFSSSAYGVAPDKKAAAGSVQNNNAPTATTGAQAETANTSVTNDNDLTKAVIEGVKEGVKEGMTSNEVEEMQRRASQAAGEAVNKTLMGA